MGVMLTGNSGNNILTGGDGNDTLDGGAGADTLIGGAGDDTYIVDNAGDVVTENAGEGTDTVQSSVSYTLSANVENLTLIGSSAFIINGTGNTLANIIIGTSGNDTLYGGNGDDALRGYGGNDVLWGENGNDSIDGESGNDTLYGGNGNDAITGGEGNDVLWGENGNDFLSGFEGNDVLYGGNGNDWLEGDEGNDILDGGDGIDGAFFYGTQASYRFALDGSVLIVSGSQGNDRLSNIENLLWPDSGSFVLVSAVVGSGLIEQTMTVVNGGIETKVIPSIYVGTVAGLQYELLGNATGDVIIGTSRNDFINLLGGDDACNAGAGNDVIDGGTGSNFLSGGAGIDTFFLDGRGGNTTWATITDWSAGEQLSVWGWRPGVSTVQWVTSAGAPGWTGVTMHGDLDGNGVIDTSVTWTGLTQSQLPTPLVFDVPGGLLWFV